MSDLSNSSVSARLSDDSLGLIHIYCGNGKGKTTCGMGLCVRAAGYGLHVLIYQFMKNNSSNERHAMEQLSNITFFSGLEHEKFSSRMTEEEKAQRRIFYAEQFRKVTQLAILEHYQLLFLDEVIYTIRCGLFDEELLLDFLRTKPKHLEVILTGQDPSDRLIEAADYVSEIRKIKHPFERGIAARAGIER